MYSIFISQFLKSEIGKKAFFMDSITSRKIKHEKKYLESKLFIRGIILLTEILYHYSH